MYNFLRTLGNSPYESPRGEDSETPLKSYKRFPYAQVIGSWKKNNSIWNLPGRDFSSIQSSSQPDLFAPVIEMQQRGHSCRFLPFPWKWKLEFSDFRFGRGYIFCMEIKSSVDQCVWMLISGLEPAKITLWASANVPSSQARVTSQKSLRSMRCNKEATVLAYYSSGQNESRSFQLRSLSFQHSELGEKALKSSAQCGEES